MKHRIDPNTYMRSGWDNPAPVRYRRGNLENRISMTVLWVYLIIYFFYVLARTCFIFNQTFLPMNIWENYKNILHETFPLHNAAGSVWANWKSKDTNLLARTYTTQYFIKSREVEIWNEKSCIYNNIIYPKTGSNLPCFGMDLMGFFDKKVIIVFDFQHPVENYSFSVEGLPVYEGDYRFFEIGNHFSKNIYIAKCTMSEVDEHLRNV